MWELLVALCWLAIPIPSAIIGFRRDEPVTGAVIGMVLCVFALVLGAWLTGWFVIAILILAIGGAFVPPTEEELEAMEAAEKECEAEFEREMRREQLKSITEDYKLGLIDAKERDRQLANAGFNPS